jgi:minor extracellular serine protease Vpr
MGANIRLRFAPLRGRVVIGVCLAALAAAPAGSAALTPVRRSFGELAIPRVRAGTVAVPRAHRTNRIRVIVTLRLPPLAQAYGRGLYAVGARRKLDVRSVSSRRYLARLDAAQARAIARLRRAIPSATVSERYRIVLDGFTVSLPYTKLPQLSRLSFAQRVWPALTYTLSLNRSPSVIGADVFHASTGANGDGVKIGVVDDGIDNTNPFLSGAGFTPPSGFPIGDPKFTSGKVIVARAFPGPGSGAGGKLPLDRRFSFHGTHVSGIAAGDAGTCAPAGLDHPATCGLSGVAPRAYLGNYRVFNVPTPIGHVAESPEIAAAFEQAVADGMDVINFSGGGPESEPLNDVLIPAVNNVAAAGVVPVIAAGNDGEDFGPGSAGTPGTAQAAISVAAVTNSQVFAPALSAFDTSGKEILHVPFQKGASSTPAGWATSDQILTDVGSIVGRFGTPVERHLCAPGSDPNANATELPPHSLDGQVALVSRGYCTFVSKAQRVADAGGVGMVLVDNRPGNANPLPIDVGIPAGMIADLDGAQLRTAMGTAGRIRIRVGTAFEDISTDRSGIVTAFSSRGPTSFGHLLKPDVSAPGSNILSSTLPEFAGSPFAVFDGTSMATPHVAGSAALLVQRHPSWTPQQVKSALVSTAGPAWADTARTQEAPVTAEGGGLVNIPRADAPLIFTNPVSLSFGDLNVNHGAQSRALLVELSDAGDGAGDWSVKLQPQSQTSGVTISVPSIVSLAPGADVSLPVVARAAADAVAGDEMGFVVLTHGDASRRVPYDFSVTRPALESMPQTQLKTFQEGDTIKGVSAVSQYRYPAWPFGPPPNYVGAPMNETGAEHLYWTRISVPTINFGAAIWLQSSNSLIHPWVLGSPDENDVQGYAGTPVNVNGLMFDYRADVEAAGGIFPLTKKYYVAVDSGSDPFTGASLPGQYLLKSWVNDLTPPRVRMLTLRVAAGRPTLAARVVDSQSGVDPLSLVINYNKILLGASAYDPVSGLALFPIPPQAPKLTKKKTPGTFVGSDLQETKNVNTIGTNVLPNTTFRNVKFTVVNGPAVSWLLPDTSTCVRGKVARVAVSASSTKPVRSVTFRDGARRIARLSKGVLGLYAADWNLTHARKGKHTLTAIARDAAGRTYTARERVRVCK